MSTQRGLPREARDFVSGNRAARRATQRAAQQARRTTSDEQMDNTGDIGYQGNSGSRVPRRRFNPGWMPQSDEVDDPDAPAFRCVAEMRLMNGQMVTIELDRFIMDAPPDMKVVHLDGNYMNCTKSNLALVPKRRQSAVEQAVTEQEDKA